jgi:NADPH2 dehydrogenase
MQDRCDGWLIILLTQGANGYLIEQFIQVCFNFYQTTSVNADWFEQDVSNQRADKYGGSIENRIRFPLELIEAVSQAIGPERTGLRLSPWSRLNSKEIIKYCQSFNSYIICSDMRMADPVPTYRHLAQEIRARFPSFAYLHVIEPRTEGMDDVVPISETDSNDFLREIWAPKPFISAGGYTRSGGIERAEQTHDLIAYGRYFIANVCSLHSPFECLDDWLLFHCSPT